MDGQLDLIYQKKQGATQMIHAFYQAPLKVQRPFYPQGHEICHTVALHTAGGIVGGDRMTQNLHLHPHSEVFFTTPAASKIYRSNGHTAHQEITLSLGDHAVLEWFPQESIVFNEADYQQKMQVSLGEGSVFLGWEITRFGRTARGEGFIQGKWRSHNQVWHKQNPLWIDRQGLTGSKETLASPHILAGYPIIGSFWALGLSLEKSLSPSLRPLLPPPNETGEFGLTTSQNYGILCRYRGSSITQVKKGFIALWHFLGQQYLHRTPLHPRIWQ